MRQYDVKILPLTEQEIEKRFSGIMIQKSESICIIQIHLIKMTV